MRKRFTNVHRLAIADYAITQMKERRLKVKDIARLLDDEPTIASAMQLAREDGVKDFEHFLKCAIAAGIVDFQELPEETRWASLNNNRCYRMPESWYQEAYNASTDISHGHLTDYIGRTKPSYLTTWTLEKYLSTIDAEYRRLVATMILISSRNNLSLPQTDRVLNRYVDEPLPHYRNLPIGDNVRYPFVNRLVEASIDDIPVHEGIELAFEDIKERPSL